MAKTKTKKAIVSKGPQMYVEVTLPQEDEDGNRTYHKFKMPIKWKVAKRLTQEAAANPKELVEAGDKLSLSDEQVIQIIHIGCQEGGCEWDEDEIGEAVILAGMTELAVPVGVYIASFLTGGVPREVLRKVLGEHQSKKSKTAGAGSGTATKSQ